jgi:hypothetical protein
MSSGGYPNPLTVWVLYLFEKEPPLHSPFVNNLGHLLHLTEGVVSSKSTP